MPADTAGCGRLEEEHMDAEKKMDMEQFAKSIKERLERLGRFEEVRLHNVPKNNGITYCGLLLRNGGDKVIPTIYLEPFFEDYKDGEDMDEIVRQILEIYENALCGSVDISFFREFATVKDRLRTKLINREANAELLEKVPYREFLDLAVVYYADCQDPQIGGAIQIYNSNMEKWGVTEKDLWEAASAITSERLPEKIAYMEDIMAEMFAGLGSGDSERCNCGMEKGSGFVPLLVITNTQRRNGAVAILYEGILKRAADKIGSDLFILPSSVHEVIAVSVNGARGADTLKKSVMMVNRNELPPEEVLSDNVYIYRREQDSLEIA